MYNSRFKILMMNPQINQSLLLWFVSTHFLNIRHSFTIMTSLKIQIFINHIIIAGFGLNQVDF